MAVDFSKKTNWAEPAGAGPSRPEPARGAIGWIFSRFSRKIKNKKDFCRFGEDFQSFSKILLAKSLQPPRASLSPARKPFDFIDISLKSLDFHDFQRIPRQGVQKRPIFKNGSLVGPELKIFLFAKERHLELSFG